MGKSIVSYDEKSKGITMALSGKFDEADAVKFVNDFIEMSNKFKTDETYLILECGELFLYPSDVFKQLNDVFQLYKQIGYKLIIFKVYRAQKELVRKVEILCDKFELEHNIFIID